jgi:hypothetical protein
MTQRRFANVWGELSYLCEKMRYWLYTRKQRTRAKRYLDRLERVLHELPDNDMAIVREEALALFHELRGDIGEAIAHRGREIELIERLHREAASPRYSASTRAYMLRDQDNTALEQRRAHLDALKKAQASETS